jgi:hypothetical protein
MDEPYSYFENLVSELPEISADSIISRTLYEDEQHKAILFGFAVGQELSEHTASQTALLYFVPHSVLAETKLVMMLILFKQ